MSNHSDKLVVTGDRDAEFSIAGLVSGISASDLYGGKSQLIAGRRGVRYAQKHLLFGPKPVSDEARPAIPIAGVDSGQ
jgi:hypothetical protein